MSSSSSNDSTSENLLQSLPTEESPAFGWTAYAERINGRFAMIGVVGLLVLELLTHQDFFTWLNLAP